MIGAFEASKQNNHGHHQPRPPSSVAKPSGGRPRTSQPSPVPESVRPYPPGTSPQQPQQPQHYNAFSPVSGQQSQRHRYHSPPPQGLDRRPTPSAQNKPPIHPHLHPPPPDVPSADDTQQLYSLFRAANASKSGALTGSELGSALVNGDYSAFDPNTVKMMVQMFDRSGNGVIRFDEFVSLWRFLAAWRELFERFDEDRSGRVDLNEFEKALVAFGYRLSPSFVALLFTSFEGKGRKRPGHGHAGLSFDLFVQACISLKRMTDVFKRYDDDRDGYITLSFEEFLTGRSPVVILIHPPLLTDIQYFPYRNHTVTGVTAMSSRSFLMMSIPGQSISMHVVVPVLEQSDLCSREE
jgi:peflin